MLRFLLLCCGAVNYPSCFHHSHVVSLSPKRNWSMQSIHCSPSILVPSEMLRPPSDIVGCSWWCGVVMFGRCEIWKWNGNKTTQNATKANEEEEESKCRKVLSHTTENAHNGLFLPKVLQQYPNRIRLLGYWNFAQALIVTVPPRRKYLWQLITMRTEERTDWGVFANRVVFTVKKIIQK